MNFSERTDGANFNIHRFNVPLNFKGKMHRLRMEMNNLTRRMGSMASEHTQNNYKVEGFVDKKIEQWPKKKKPNNKKILVDTGRMKNTTRMMFRTRNFVKLATPVPYGAIHNRKVGEIKVYNGKSYPGRKFMGHSVTLATATGKMIVTRLNIAAQQ